ncbi:MAG: nitrilase-related carbon-nitrogen hydrolase [Marinifilaceae bacterium]
MRLEIIQFAPVLGDLEATLLKLEKMFFKAQYADWVVLPELANSGYNFKDREEAFSIAESTDDSRFLEFIMLQCKKYDLRVCTGFCERVGDKLYNSSVLVDAKGVLGTYRKLHLFMREKEIFEPGNLGAPLFEVDGVKIGMLICFDWMFPEIWRKLAIEGADLIFHSANLVLPHAQNVVPTYSLVNRIYIATANRTGAEDNLKFTGNSVVTDPGGKVLAKASKKEEVIMVEIDPFIARNKMVTAKNHAFLDRRPEFY